MPEKIRLASYGLTERTTMDSYNEEVVTTACATHCGGACLMKAHVKDGVITRIETDDGEEPQLRCCLKCRAYRQRIYAPDRIKYPFLER